MTPALKQALDLHQPVGELPIGYERGDPDTIAAFRLQNRVRTSLLDDDWPKKVMAFHRLYALPGGDGPIRPLDPYRKILRERLLSEEVAETNAASEAGDVVETIDGLLDTIYVAIGWMLELGMTPAQINLAMQEVHASNMTKTDLKGKPIFDEGGKVLKGDNYVKADLQLALSLDSSPPL